MKNYIANSQNRKLKNKIALFLSRLNLGAGKLPLAGRVILMMCAILAVSILFPWFGVEYLDKSTERFYAFSVYTGYIGIGILLALFFIPFFLISHAKKERIRAYVPFRLSDTQAVVFVASLLLVSMIQLISLSRIFLQFAPGGVTFERGFFIAFTSIIVILVASFSLSKSMKEQSIEMRYLDHHEVDTLGEYRSIISNRGSKSEKEDDSNMSLPI